jgi:hypothetical protein
VNVLHSGAVAIALAGGLAAGIAGTVLLAPHAHADVMTVDGIDYPVCTEEDCSDQPNQVGVWQDPDTSAWWLSLGETHSLPVH